MSTLVSSTKSTWVELSEMSSRFLPSEELSWASRPSKIFDMPGITPPGMHLPRNCFHSFTTQKHFLSANSSWSRFYIFVFSFCCFHNFRFQTFTYKFSKVLKLLKLFSSFSSLSSFLSFSSLWRILTLKILSLFCRVYTLLFATVNFFSSQVHLFKML